MNTYSPGKHAWMVLAVALVAVSNLHAQQLGTVISGPAEPYDVGYNPSVAGSLVAGAPGTYMLEVHNGQNGAGPMWYHVGLASYAWPAAVPSISWAQYEQYDWGYNPSVAGCPQSNTVVEVHMGQEGPGSLWYHVGFLSGPPGATSFQTVVWGPPETFGEGSNPKVALLCVGQQYAVVEVHNGMPTASGQRTMYYRVGFISPALWINWAGPAQPYDVGWDPSVAIYGSTVVEVHNNASATPGSLWYHVGEFNSAGTITWGPAYFYDNGWEPKVALVASNGNDDLAPLGAPLVIEVHNGQGSFGPMWYHLGKVRNHTAISWAPPMAYDQGWNPSASWLWLEDYNFVGAVEVHNGQEGFGTLWSHGDLWDPPGGFTVDGGD